MNKTVYKSVLFIGNGIPQWIGSADKWEELLIDLKIQNDPYFNSEVYKKEKESYEGFRFLPSSMQVAAATNADVGLHMYYICQRLLQKADLTETQKEKCRKVLDLPFSDIITTNYTLELEKSADCELNNVSDIVGRPSITDADFSYCIRNCSEIHLGEKAKKIWHIHGIVTEPESIIMGHLYYGFLLAEIIKVAEKTKARYDDCVRNNQQFVYENWIDHFLVDDVYILGFSLDFSEQDIWWLVSYKHYAFPDSKIYFFSPGRNLKSNSKRGEMLRTYGVHIITDEEDRIMDYNKYYENVIKDIDAAVSS